MSANYQAAFDTATNRDDIPLHPNNEYDYYSGKANPRRFNLKLLCCVGITILALIIVLVLLFRSHSHAHDHDIIFYNTTIYKPKTDQRTYKHFRLKNGMNVLAISDPTATKSASSLSVGAGAWVDPVEMPGAAHYIEHLLFFASEKYPTQDLFQNFVAVNGGGSNAVTENEETNYHFDVSSSYFDKSLDIFYNMFKAPIFKLEWAKDEVSAVNSEYMLDINNPASRNMYALRILSDQKSPFVQFGIGNSDTLIDIPTKKGTDIMELIKKFVDRYYAATLMSLVVLHNKPMDEIVHMVADKFSHLPQKDRERPHLTELPKPFSVDNSGKVLQFVPVDKEAKLSVVFSIEGIKIPAITHAVSLIYKLLQYEGQGSLLSILEGKGWVIKIEVGHDSRSQGFELMLVHFSLADDGIQNKENILRYFFAYLDLIKQKGLTQEMFTRWAAISQYQFAFTQYGDDDDIQSVVDEIAKIASNMNYFRIENALSGEKVLIDFDKVTVDKHMESIIVDNMMLLSSDPSYGSATEGGGDGEGEGEDQKGDEEKSEDGALDDPNVAAGTSQTDSTKDRYLKLASKTDKYYALYHLNYTITDIPKEFLNELKKVKYQDYKDLQLPGANEYVPHNFDLVKVTCKDDDTKCVEDFAADRKNLVKSIVRNDKMTTYYTLERSFNVPLILGYFKLQRGDFSTDIKLYTSSKIFNEAVSSTMRYALYDMQSAGFKLNFDMHSFTIDAYSDKFEKVLDVLLKSYKDLVPTKEIFDQAKDSVSSELSEELTEKITEIASQTISKLMKQSGFTHVDLYSNLKALTFEDFQANCVKFRTSSYVQSYFFGNLKEADASKYSQKIVDTLGLQAYDQNSLTKTQVLNVVGQNIVYRTTSPALKDKTTLTLNYYQNGVSTPKDLACLKLVTTILNAEAFTYLRTENKLGYSVGLSEQIIGNVTGMSALVVSSSNNTNEVDKVVEAFWRERAKKVVDALTDQSVATLAKSFEETQKYDAKSFKNKEKDLRDHIEHEDYRFDSKEKLIAETKKLTSKDLKDFYQNLVGTARKVSIQLYSTTNKAVPTEFLSANDQYSRAAPVKYSDDDFKKLPKYA